MLNARDKFKLAECEAVVRENVDLLSSVLERYDGTDDNDDYHIDECLKRMKVRIKHTIKWLKDNKDY